jgi:hypothetical protein
MKKKILKINLLIIPFLLINSSELFSQLSTTEINSWEVGVTYNTNGFLGSVSKLSDCPSCSREFSEGDAGEIKFNFAYFNNFSNNFSWGAGVSSSLDFWYFKQSEFRPTFDSVTKTYPPKEISYETKPFVWDFSFSGKIRYSIGKFKITSSVELVLPLIKTYDQSEKLVNAGTGSFGNNSNKRNTFTDKKMKYFSATYLSTDIKFSYDIKNKARDQSIISPYLMLSYSITSLHKDEDWKYYSFGFGIDLRLPTYSAGNTPLEPNKD